MAGELDGRRVAVLAADGVERVELEQLRRLLEDAGTPTEVVSITGGEIQARDHDLADAVGWVRDVVGEEVVTDGTLTTSRSPDDLPASCARIVAESTRPPQASGRTAPR